MAVSLVPYSCFEQISHNTYSIFSTFPRSRCPYVYTAEFVLVLFRQSFYPDGLANFVNAFILWVSLRPCQYLEQHQMMADEL
jgi:hypothetical protein